MSKIVLYPAGNGDAGNHYVDTLIAHPPSIATISPFVDKGIGRSLKELHPNGIVPTWGVRPGVGNRNRTRWERIRPSDMALFARNGRIFASATIAFTMHNRDLAQKLWWTDSDGTTWEYISFLGDIKNQNILYADFNRAAGYQPNYAIFGFNVLEEERSQAIIAHFELENRINHP